MLQGFRLGCRLRVWLAEWDAVASRQFLADPLHCNESYDRLDLLNGCVRPEKLAPLSADHKAAVVVIEADRSEASVCAVPVLKRRIEGIDYLRSCCCGKATHTWRVMATPRPARETTA